MTNFHHVDVFSRTGYAGNSVAVFVDPPDLTAHQMLQITQELRHFESIFLWSTNEPTRMRTHVFDLTEELAFAGHPLLGAAAVLHELSDARDLQTREWTFALDTKSVPVTTRRNSGGSNSARMDQGRPEWIAGSAQADRHAVAAALGLEATDLHDAFPLEVVSTGLEYLIVPVRHGVLARARITHTDFASFLDAVGARFAYLLDVDAVEGRHWNNDGVMEDVATGSAAGCVAAYLLRHGRSQPGERISLSQGRFVGRPSTIVAAAYGEPHAIDRVEVSADVVLVSSGRLLSLPNREQS